MAQGRKGRRRTHKPTPIDEDLSLLASVLDEYRLDNSARDWFKVPWRDGREAAVLALLAAARFSSFEGPTVTAAGHELLELTDKLDDPNTYERAGQCYQHVALRRFNTDAARLVCAGARCLQLRLANSHGGGHTYNEILIGAFLGIDEARVEDLVLLQRCRDALGRGAYLDERRRSAFTIAWKRGLYLAAYAISPLQ